jgi:hypothetical protein
MAQTVIRDVVIWAKHIHGGDVADRVMALRGGETIELIVDGVKGTWRKMDDGRDGRPTSGVRPIGRMQDFWRELYAKRRGDVVPLEAAETKAAPVIYPALGKTPEERKAALEALIGLADEGYRSNGLVITRDDMHDRELDREGL